MADFIISKESSSPSELSSLSLGTGRGIQPMLLKWKWSFICLVHWTMIKLSTCTYRWAIQCEGLSIQWHAHDKLFTVSSLFHEVVNGVVLEKHEHIQHYTSSSLTIGKSTFLSITVLK